MKRFSKTKLRFSPKFDNKDSQIELNLIKKFFSEYKNKDIKEIYQPCLYPYSNTIINPMGDIYPCLSYKIGNIKENSITQILSSDKIGEFINRYSEKPVLCKECEYRKFEIFDGKYSDFKRETGGFKREEKDDKPSFQRKDLKENARKARGGKRVFDARKEKGSDDKGDYRKRENRRDDQETRKPRFDRKNFDRSPEKEGGKYDERRVSKEEIIANNQQFTAAYDLDDEIKIGKYRRFRLHGDEAVRTYVKGRKPSIGEKKEKPTPRRNKRDNKK